MITREDIRELAQFNSKLDAKAAPSAFILNRARRTTSLTAKRRF